ncbi:MAG TPA: DUF2199 domain-containing protein [Mycobacteriales bacterium]|nr:DUF2199 domain-containing protein [Mycobacteriales bacterium]
MCGRPVHDHDRHIRFRLPDPVLATPEREQAAGVWLSHEDANNSVMMQVPEVGPFVRALLPVRLTGGYTVTFGVWIGVAPPDLQRAFQSWWSPDYPQLQLTGRLANTLPYWGLLAAHLPRMKHRPTIRPGRKRSTVWSGGREWLGCSVSTILSKPRPDRPSRVGTAAANSLVLATTGALS